MEAGALARRPRFGVTSVATGIEGWVLSPESSWANPAGLTRAYEGTDLMLVLLDGLIFVAIIALLAFGAYRSCMRHGRHRWLTVSTLVFCGLLVGIMLVWSRDREVLVSERLQRQVAGLAPTYADEVARLGHAELDLDTPPDDEDYLRIIEAQRRWLAINPSISDIYTFRLIDGENILIADSETDYDRNGSIEGKEERRTPIGESFGEITEDEKRAAAGEVIFTSELLTDRWGTWISAYAPLYDAAGRVEGVLGVDLDASTWIGTRAAARREILIFGGGLIVLVLASVAVLSLRENSLFESRLYAEQLAIAKAAAERAAVAKSEFLSNMSHEIRTPLTAILGYTELMEQESDASEPTASHIKTIRRNGLHLLTLLDQILDFSKIGAGAMVLESIPFEVRPLIDEVVELLRVRADVKAITLGVEIDAQVPAWVEGDPTRLRQILINLVSNAIKFTETGGVTVRTAVVRGQTDQLRIEISDTGIGMTQSTMNNLFRAFSQGDSSITRRHGGTGLGLRISQQLTELFGGTIGVRSTVGLGTTFTVILPLRACDAPAPEALREGEQPDTTALRGAHILLAEDSADNRRLLNAFLTRAEAVVEHAENGREAVEAVTRAARIGRPFDLVLMDIQMPELDGRAATRALRESGVSTPIVALTAHSISEELQSCRDAGCDDVLTKPISPERLLRECARWLGPAAERDAA